MKFRIPSYRLHKSDGRAVVTLCGRDYYLGRYGTIESREDYADLIATYRELRGEPKASPAKIAKAIEAYRASKNTRSGKNLTVVEAAEKYLAHSRDHHSKVEQAHVRGMLKCFLRIYEQESVENIGPKALREIRKDMISQDWSRHYVNDQVGRIKRFYKWLVGEELLPVTAYHSLLVVPGLRRGKGEGARETKRILPVADAVVEATLPHLPEVVADMVRVQWRGGMRPIEVCIMRPCDIDRNFRKDVWLYRPSSHKTQHHGKERLVALGAEAQTVLLKYLARDAESFCFQPRDSEAKRRSAPAGKHIGSRYAVQVYRRAIHRACKKAKVQRWSPNQLRHSFGTEVRHKFSLEHARTSLGHSKADVTQVYAERDIELAVEVARKIG